MCGVRCRVLEISDQVRQVLNQPYSQCTITPAPADSAEADSAVALAKRCLCKVLALSSLVATRPVGIHSISTCMDAESKWWSW